MGFTPTVGAAAGRRWRTHTSTDRQKKTWTGYLLSLVVCVVHKQVSFTIRSRKHNHQHVETIGSGRVMAAGNAIYFLHSLCIVWKMHRDWNMQSVLQCGRVSMCSLSTRQTKRRPAVVCRHGGFQIVSMGHPLGVDMCTHSTPHPAGLGSGDRRPIRALLRCIPFRVPFVLHHKGWIYRTPEDQ